MEWDEAAVESEGRGRNWFCCVISYVAEWTRA